MRIKHSLQLAIAEDADMKDPLFGPTDETLIQVIIDGYTSAASGKVKVLATITKALPLGDVQLVRGIYLEVDQDCSIKINDGAAIALKRGNSTTGALAKFFLEAALTKVEVVAGSIDVHGTYCVWGDPSA
jgi:hypothetical protein